MDIVTDYLTHTVDLQNKKLISGVKSNLSQLYNIQCARNIKEVVLRHSASPQKHLIIGRETAC